MTLNWQQHIRGGVRAGWYDADLRPCSKKNGVYYFQSKRELNRARILEQLRRAGDIIRWEHQPETWDFLRRTDRILRAHTTYRPDFWVLTSSGEYWIEVKGYLNQRGRVVLEHAVKYYPERLLLVDTQDGLIEAKEYLGREKQKRARKLQGKRRATNR